AEGHDARAASQRALVVEDELLHGTPARAAVFLGPVVGKPAALVEDGVPFLLVGFGQALPGLDLARNVLGQLVLQEGLDFLAEGLLFGGELEIHAWVPRVNARFLIACCTCFHWFSASSHS